MTSTYYFLMANPRVEEIAGIYRRLFGRDQLAAQQVPLHYRREFVEFCVVHRTTLATATNASHVIYESMPPRLAVTLTFEDGSTKTIEYTPTGGYS